MPNQSRNRSPGRLRNTFTAIAPKPIAAITDPRTTSKNSLRKWDVNGSSRYAKNEIPITTQARVACSPENLAQNRRGVPTGDPQR
jgi:hypothetical protein